MLQRLIVLAMMLALAFPCSVWAGNRTIETEYTTMLGENDTRAQARRQCFEAARRQAMEQAGAYVESSTEVSNLALTKDEVRTFAAAVVETELVSEDFFLKGGAYGLTCKVRAVVDTDSLSRKLAEYSSDPERKRRLENLSRREGELAAGSGEAAPRRDLPSPEELEREKAKLRDEVKRLGSAARQVVEPGMTMEEVQSLLGPPRVKKLNDKMTATYECHNYGNIWVVYKDGLVACTRKRLTWKNSYQSDCHCSGMTGEVFFQ